MAVTPGGDRFYIPYSYYDSINVYDVEEGEKQAEIELLGCDICYPSTICLDRTGKYACMGHVESNKDYASLVRLTMDNSTEDIISVQSVFTIRIPSILMSSHLFGDRYLAVGTRKAGLLVFDISDMSQ